MIFSLLQTHGDYTGGPYPAPSHMLPTTHDLAFGLSASTILSHLRDVTLTYSVLLGISNFLDMDSTLNSTVIEPLNFVPPEACVRKMNASV